MTTEDLTGPDRHGDRGNLVLVLIGAIVLVIVAANFAGGPVLGAAALVGLIGATVITRRPAYAVALLLASFLVTTPIWLQGRGFLTLNNVLGGFLAVLMIHQLYRRGDWSLLKHRELYLMMAITAVYLLSRYLNRPDDHTMALVTGLSREDQDPARVIVNRLLFLVFFLYFIRTWAEIRLVFLLATGLMILSGFAGIWRVLSGGGFAGYRASSGVFIWAAGNPNRLALTCTIGVIVLWYLMQWQRRTVVALPVIATIGVLVLAVFMTGSRSGVVGLVAASGLLFLEGGLSVRKLIVGILIGLCGSMLILSAAPEKSLERIGNLPGTQSASELGAGSLARRSYIAGFALEVADENPLFGVGVGNWEITRFLKDPTHSVSAPHNSVLMALAEGGLVTLALYAWLLLRTLRNFLHSGAALSDYAHRSARQWMVKSLRASFIIFLAMSLVGDLWLNILFYWFIGLGVTTARIVFREVPVEEPETESGMLMEATA